MKMVGDGLLFQNTSQTFEKYEWFSIFISHKFSDTGMQHSAHTE